MSLKFRKPVNNTSATNTEKQQNQLYINLGFEIEIEGEMQFVNLPLSLTADNLDKAIESVRGRINKNTPSHMVEVLEGKCAIAEAVKALFKEVEEGQSVKASDIDPDDEAFGFLAGLEIQFFRAETKQAIDTSASNVSVTEKFRKKVK